MFDRSSRRQNLSRSARRSQVGFACALGFVLCGLSSAAEKGTGLSDRMKRIASEVTGEKSGIRTGSRSARGGRASYSARPRPSSGGEDASEAGRQVGEPDTPERTPISVGSAVAQANSRMDEVARLLPEHEARVEQYGAEIRDLDSLLEAGIFGSQWDADRAASQRRYAAHQVSQSRDALERLNALLDSAQAVLDEARDGLASSP